MRVFSVTVRVFSVTVREFSVMVRVFSMTVVCPQAAALLRAVGQGAGVGAVAVHRPVRGHRALPTLWIPLLCHLVAHLQL